MTVKSGHAFKRCDGVNLYRARMCFGLDGVAFWRQLCAVPADDAALPRGARLFANAISHPKRRGKRRLDLLIAQSMNFHVSAPSK
jgi:hypothetical protein